MLLAHPLEPEKKVWVGPSKDCPSGVTELGLAMYNALVTQAAQSNDAEASAPSSRPHVAAPPAARPTPTSPQPAPKGSAWLLDHDPGGAPPAQLAAPAPPPAPRPPVTNHYRYEDFNTAMREVLADPSINPGELVLQLDKRLPAVAELGDVCPTEHDISTRGRLLQFCKENYWNGKRTTIEFVLRYRGTGLAGGELHLDENFFEYKKIVALQQQRLEALGALGSPAAPAAASEGDRPVTLGELRTILQELRGGPPAQASPEATARPLTTADLPQLLEGLTARLQQAPPDPTQGLVAQAEALGKIVATMASTRDTLSGTLAALAPPAPPAAAPARKTAEDLFLGLDIAPGMQAQVPHSMVDSHPKTTAAIANLPILHAGLDKVFVHVKEVAHIMNGTDPDSIEREKQKNVVMRERVELMERGSAVIELQKKHKQGGGQAPAKRTGSDDVFD